MDEKELAQRIDDAIDLLNTIKDALGGGGAQQAQPATSEDIQNMTPAEQGK